MKKYDVFISFKRNAIDGSGKTRDCVLAEELHRTLRANGIEAFFSEKDLSTSSFTEEIYDALDEAKILIVVGTKAEHVTSKWVNSEWNSFLATINGGRKPDGEIITYLEGITKDDLPFALYVRESFMSNDVDSLVKWVKKSLGLNEVEKEENAPIAVKTPQSPILYSEPTKAESAHVVTQTKAKVRGNFFDKFKWIFDGEADEVLQKSTQWLKVMSIVIIVALIAISSYSYQSVGSTSLYIRIANAIELILISLLLVPPAFSLVKANGIENNKACSVKSARNLGIASLLIIINFLCVIMVLPVLTVVETDFKMLTFFNEHYYNFIVPDFILIGNIILLISIRYSLLGLRRNIKSLVCWISHVLSVVLEFIAWNELVHGGCDWFSWWLGLFYYDNPVILWLVGLLYVPLTIFSVESIRKNKKSVLGWGIIAVEVTILVILLVS